MVIGRKRQLTGALESLRTAATLCIEPRESKVGVLIDTASTLLSLGIFVSYSIYNIFTYCYFLGEYRESLRC